MPHLILVEKGSGKTHRVEGSEALAGRDPSCGLFLEGDEAKTVSARHARFSYDDTRWYVEDAGSRNGTYIGTRKLDAGDRHALTVGEVVGLGLTGTQLSVREAVGRAFAATMLESAPSVPPSVFAGEEVRLVLRGVHSDARSIGQANRITIGRALECLIRIEGDAATSVSRVHAEVSAENGKVMLRDGGSRHGTFVNEKRSDAPTPIEAGDVLMFGLGGPEFAVEEVSIVPAGSMPAAARQPEASQDPSVGPTGVRAAASKAKADPQAEIAAAMQPTPSGNVPAFRKAAAPRPPSGPPAVSRSQPSRRTLWGGIAVVAAATIAVFFIAKQRSEARSEAAFELQVGALEATREAAVADAAKAKAVLDSAINADAPPAFRDSLTQVLAGADRQSALITDSLEHVRARAPRAR